MKFKFIVSIFLAAFCLSNAQENDVLFTVNDTPVTSKEFKRVYNKNIDLVKDENQKDVDEYLELYIKYKLKLEEAKALKLDQDKQYINELGSYKRQLSKKYLTDTEITEQLLKEAYDRTVTEVNANHILVRVDENVKPEDSLDAYTRILKYRDEAIEKGFESTMTKYHDGKVVFGEPLGYFTAFKMVYPFENAAYNTEVGEVSMPFRTRFGYHIVNVVDKRTSMGEVTVAHIMVSNKNDKLTNTPEERINELYNQLNEGAVFEDLARQFSDDKNSAKNGGKLSRFGAGKLNAVEFEEVAFSLTNPGDISTPVKTKYGWHIIKLIKKHPIDNFDKLRNSLEASIRKDERSKKINEKFYSDIKSRYNFKEVSHPTAQMMSVINKDFVDGNWKPKNVEEYKTTLFSFANQEVTYLDFYNNLSYKIRRYKNTKDFNKLAQESYDDFVNETIFQYHSDNLENEFEDFAAIIQEYREGLLLFDLMEKEIWDKSKKDSVGLENYYASNKNKYFWGERLDAVVVTTSSKSEAKNASKLLKTTSDIDKLNQTLDGVVSEGIYEVNNKELPIKYKFKTGVSKVFKHNNQYVVVKGLKILTPALKTYDEVKGKVINDYQEQMEIDWLEELRKKYPVKVNQEVLSEVKKVL